MKILLIFTFYLISGSVRCFDVTGYSGGSVIVDSGNLWCDECSKYMDKHDPWTTIIYYKKHDQLITEGRFTLYRNNDGNLMIFIRELNTHDTGRYWIGVYWQWSIEMFLIVNKDSSCNVSKNVMVNIGEISIISCEYSQNKIYDVRFICKQGKDSIDEVIHSTDTWNKGRFSISDDRNKKVFSVNITSVTVDDVGVYLCGVRVYRYSYSNSIITAVHLHIINKVGSYKVTGYSGGQIIIKCEHPQYKTNPKYICKESDGCSERKYPGVENKWVENGDVSLYDDTRGGVLMVFFRDLNAGDAGTYRCGVNISQYTEWFTEVKLDVKDDASLVQRVYKSVYVGEEVNITCQIPEEHEVSSKHFCKEDDDHICQTVNTSEVTQMNSLSERNAARVFTVSISNLTVRDAGVYWCGTETSEEHLSFISLTTKVQLNLIMPPVFGHEGESVEIICPYDPIYKSKSKYLCKGTCSTRDRNPLTETVRDQNETKTGRLTLNDDIIASVFTVTITGLTAEDAGKYCCAMTLERDVNCLYTHLIIIRKQEMILNQYERDNISIKCKHHDEHQKFFCKGHQASVCAKDGVSLETIRDDGFSLSDETLTGVFTVNITDLRQEDSGIYWCGSDVITKVILEVKNSVSGPIIAGVCVASLLMGGLVLLLYKLRHIKTPDRSTSRDRTEMRNAQVPHVPCDYENINDIRPYFVSHSEETVQYSTMKLPTESSDPHNMIYSTVQLPSNSSDGLLYAAVRFQKHEDCLTDDTDTFSKKIYSDYASVNHLTRLN
ncbi:polymeric immunoglobulin receptor-like [Myxocyprinus asiaticus]|uniref:polymeric immunoglobulin receptor-like n=1 Tax=Myxocyprinus asiaticus TaxID=70543 RepID=UPI002221DC77|nr:polymeric immunoglobulin receptor-like [Myxocyprinus asiaticus]